MAAIAPRWSLSRRARDRLHLASADGQKVPAIADALRRDRQTVRNALHAFNPGGLPALRPGSSRPHSIQLAFGSRDAQRLRALLHQSPRTFGKPTSLWTLELAAEVSFVQGLTPLHVTGETIRATPVRLGVKGRRAKEWITRPDPASARKKGPETA